MMLLAPADAIRARRAVVMGPLAPLATSLAAELDALRGRELAIPREKALLSRAGGRCPRDGVPLEFDPFSPHAHRCSVCGQVYVGELHDRFWVFSYQLWLVERAVHAALLAALGAGDERADLAARILDGYADQYLDYPNRDNVLGPTRLFFSTYLESIWLLNLCVATDLLEGQSPRFAALGQRVRDRVVEPSRALIASYDEGGSNRQVWNDAALLAAARLLRRDLDAREAVFGRSGIVQQLSTNLLPDGTWYEGENYHLFAHRGLWYGVTMAEAAGMELPAPLVARFHEGFATPFLTALPDMTLPSRRDSQYAISVRQPRFAELCELGLAREIERPDAHLVAVLRRLYTDECPRRDTGRAHSTADVERNLPPTSLTRADLGWRSLLFALPILPPLEDRALGSVLLESQGIAVFRRRSDQVYAALDFGRSGGGHGHPDRLNLLLFDGETRWLDDMGTGSYVDPSLHWYRSTLAHNAPLVDGRSQRLADGALTAFGERGSIGWIEAAFAGLAPGVEAHRTLVTLPDYAVDELTWRAPGEITFDLPLHVDAELLAPNVAPIAATLAGGDGLEDGFRFVRDTTVVHVDAGDLVPLLATSNAKRLRAFVRADGPTQWWHALAPGPPGSGARPFLLIRTRGHAGRITILWSWSEHVVRADLGDRISVALTDGSRHIHERTKSGWRVEMHTAGATSTVDLERRRAAAPASVPVPSAPSAHRLPEVSLPLGRELTFDLGEAAYRRSEESWLEAGQPSARVTLGCTGSRLTIDVDVAKTGELTFAPADTENPYDNEQADVNGDGVQLYVDAGGVASGWLLSPVDPRAPRGDMRARPIDGWSSPREINATWERTASGYRVQALIALDPTATGDALAAGVIVNERPAYRERRRGQLVLGGAHGEFVYLRGDRQERDHLVRFRLAR